MHHRIEPMSPAPAASGSSVVPRRRRTVARSSLAATAAVVAACLVTSACEGSGKGDTASASQNSEKCAHAASATSGSGGKKESDSSQKAEKPEKKAKPEPQPDFDGDGNADLVTPVPGGKVDSTSSAGYLAVTYGSGDGAGSGRHQLLTQDDDVPGKLDKTMASPNKIGSDTAARDFDGDGYTDLATNTDTGADYYASGGDVAIIWGSEDGLKEATPLKDVSDGEQIKPGFFASSDPTEAGLTGGDFDGDGHADLVLGLGSKKGLLKGPFDRHGNPDGVGEVPEPELPHSGDDIETNDVIAGDLNGDGADDLVSLHGLDSLTNFIAGGENGFKKADKSLVPGGKAAAVGDVDKDGYGDLILGRKPSSKHGGSLEVYPGSPDGPEKSRRSVIDRCTPGVPGERAKEDKFGAALTTADVDDDGYADVVAGAAGDKVDGEEGAGSATLFKGSGDGLTGKDAQALDTVEGDDEASADIGGGFGASVRLLDMTGDGRAELATGAPDAFGWKGAGWLLSNSGGQLKKQDADLYRPGDFDAEKSDAHFGESLTR